MLCDFCKEEIKEVTAKKVARACGLLMANDDEVFALTIWHNELVQLLNYLAERKVNQDSIQSVVEEVTKNGKLPLKLKCL